ncbi:MAG: rhomboid family intramembrane serine protease [Vitreimonas sp.]
MSGLNLTPVVAVIGGLCVAVFLLTLTMTPAQQDGVIAQYGLIPARFDSASPWRFQSWTEAGEVLVGHAFLHAGILHLLMNMLVFLQAGPFVEQRMGSVRFALLYGMSILGGAAAYVLINPHSVEPAVGASGAICGVFAAYFLAVRPTPRAALSDPRVRNGMFTFVGINVVLVALLPLPIAWEAHLGGFIAGALAYLVLAPRSPAGPWG